jgi:hypothetical protein
MKKTALRLYKMKIVSKSGFGDCIPIIAAAAMPVRVPIISAINSFLSVSQVSFQN